MDHNTRASYVAVEGQDFNRLTGAKGSPFNRLTGAKGSPFNI